MGVMDANKILQMVLIVKACSCVLPPFHSKIHTPSPLTIKLYIKESRGFLKESHFQNSVT